MLIFRGLEVSILGSGFRDSTHKNGESDGKEDGQSNRNWVSVGVNMA